MVQDFASRQADAVDVAYLLADGEDVHVEGARAELGAVLASTIGGLETFAPGLQFANGPVAVEGDHQVVEVATVFEADRLAFVDPRDGKLAKGLRQGVQADANMLVALDIAAKTQGYQRHQWPPGR